MWKITNYRRNIKINRRNIKIDRRNKKNQQGVALKRTANNRTASVSFKTISMRLTVTGETLKISYFLKM